MPRVESHTARADRLGRGSQAVWCCGLIYLILSLFAGSVKLQTPRSLAAADAAPGGEGSSSVVGC